MEYSIKLEYWNIPSIFGDPKCPKMCPSWQIYGIFHILADLWNMPYGLFTEYVLCGIFQRSAHIPGFCYWHFYGIFHLRISAGGAVTGCVRWQNCGIFLRHICGIFFLRHSIFVEYNLCGKFLEYSIGLLGSGDMGPVTAEL